MHVNYRRQEVLRVTYVYQAFRNCAESFRPRARKLYHYSRKSDALIARDLLVFLQFVVETIQVACCSYMWVTCHTYFRLLYSTYPVNAELLDTQCDTGTRNLSNCIGRSRYTFIDFPGCIQSASSGNTFMAVVHLTIPISDLRMPWIPASSAPVSPRKSYCRNPSWTSPTILQCSVST